MSNLTAYEVSKDVLYDDETYRLEHLMKDPDPGCNPSPIPVYRLLVDNSLWRVVYETGPLAYVIRMEEVPLTINVVKAVQAPDPTVYGGGRESTDMRNAITWHYLSGKRFRDAGSGDVGMPCIVSDEGWDFMVKGEDVRSLLAEMVSWEIESVSYDQANGMRFTRKPSKGHYNPDSPERAKVWKFAFVYDPIGPAVSTS